MGGVTVKDPTPATVKKLNRNQRICLEVAARYGHSVGSLKRMKTLSRILGLLVLAAVTSASAQTIAQWTFETSVPATAGPLSPEVGTGSALGFHAGVSVYSNPAGNGSAESWSSTVWAIGDYYQFSLSTVGYSGIGLSFDQTSSNTGPRDYDLTYSTDGVTFNPIASYVVLANGAAPNASWNNLTYQSAYTLSYDLSAIPAVNNAASLTFRLVNTSTVSANGGVVATGGTDRVDNFTVAVVPEPTGLLALGGLMLIAGRKLMVKRS
jgi:hypothetical protein